MPPPAEAIAAIRAWMRLDAAIAGFDAELRRRHGVTGAQLAMLRIVAEQAPVALADLRARLVLHPATLGQMIDRLAKRRLVAVGRDPSDARRRLVEPTSGGRELLAQVPLAGPVRLRHEPAEPARLRALAAAFDDAVQLFALTPWAPPAAPRAGAPPEAARPHSSRPTDRSNGDS